MPNEPGTYDPHAELKVLTDRNAYHLREARRQVTIAAALTVYGDHTWTIEQRTYVAGQAQHAGDMATYHQDTADETFAQMQDAQARCNDLDGRHATALRAAADAADMAGDVRLAIELNRRAARAEGYDPDHPQDHEEVPDPDEAWDDLTHHDDC